MKPQKELTFSVALLFLAQNIIFPIGAEAQSQTSQVIGAVGGVLSQIPGMYSKAPSTPDFSSSSTALQSKMNQCLILGTAGVTGDVAADTKGATATVEKWKNLLSKKDGKSTPVTSAKKCDADCSKIKPTAPDEPSCSEYGYDFRKETVETKTGSREVEMRSPKGDALAKRDKNLAEINDYVSCLKGKEECGDANQEELKKQQAVFDCQMQALQASVQEAHQALSFSLQQNQKAFTDMNQHQKEVDDQIQQVDKILGPDPELGKSGSSQFQGLLGLQKELNDNLPKMVEAEAKFKTDAVKLKADTTTNEQNLEASRVNVASQCIKGSRNIGTSGGYSLTCFKQVMQAGKDGASTPVFDRNGKPTYSKQSCGPYDFIRSKIEQKALLTSRGPIKSGERLDNSAANALAFDSLVDSINRAMGDYDQKGADNARLDTDVHSWSDIEAKVSSNIDAVASQSGVDVRSMLRSVAGHCFQEADGWKNKQIRSTDSEYSKKKAELKATQTNLTAQMDSGLTSMNKTYSDVMSVLYNKHVALNRDQCTKDNPELMQDCFAKIRQNVQNLLEGNGSLTATAKTIKGGTSTQPFVVSCRGLNGCVTAFKNVRDQQKTYLSDVQKKKEAYVAQSNQATQSQLAVFSGQLSTMQNSLLQQYDKMRATMVKMGVNPPEKPNFMTPEPLEAMEGADKSQGPYKNPKNMSSVLSGMMQPSGMINFSDTGMRDLQKEVAEKAGEKKSKNAETLKEYLVMQKKYNNILEECSINVAGMGGEDSPVQNFAQTCDECAAKALACQNNSGGIAEVDFTEIDGEIKAADAEIKTLSESKAKLGKKFSKADQTKLDQVIAAKKILVSDRAKMAKRTPADDKSAQNFETLKMLSEIFGKMADQSSEVEVSKLDRSNMNVLRLLGSKEGCEGLYTQCKACSDQGKKGYSEDGRLKADGTIKGQ